MRNIKIAILGPYPPPIGGVSVHVSRLIEYLNNNNKSVILYDTSKISKELNINYKYINNMKLWLITYLFRCNDNLIHLHEKNWYIVAIVCLIAKLHKAKIILTIHSFREEPSKYNFIKKIAFKYSMKSIHNIISVGENEKRKLIEYGIDSKKIVVVPAYINPNYDKKDDLLVPNYIYDYINSSEFCICANASKLTFYNNEDLYGLDLCIELCNKLKEKYIDKKIKFIFCLPSIGDYIYYKKIQLRINKLQIQNEFLIITEEIPLCPILNRVQLFLRPTNTDGDAISIREAMFYKIPTIASDVCNRPEGTILFKNRDFIDLYRKTIDVIENYPDYKDKLNNIIISDNMEKILNIYRKVIGKE